MKAKEQRKHASDPTDISYFKKFLKLDRKGEIRLLAGTPTYLQRELEEGHVCYLVIMDPLKQ